jgi:hypothetical protein
MDSIKPAPSSTFSTCTAAHKFRYVNRRVSRRRGLAG